jgi:choline dehydrogenase-like flavoprotein
MSGAHTFPAGSVLQCDRLDTDLVIDTDIVVVGTGAGGGVAAEIFAGAGLRVLMVEAGDHKTTADFHMQEAEAYPQLYHEVANRKTADNAITILQGRTVGGSTTVNWTLCFEIPEQTLRHWGAHYGLDELNAGTLAPWYARMRERLHVQPWPAHNPANTALLRGARKLGWEHSTGERNVKACRALGYCGTGCPVGAKQSMLTTTIPAALRAGARLLTRCRAERIRFGKDRVTGLECAALNRRGSDVTGKRVTIRAQHYVIAAGGIESPGLLLRSQVPDPSGLLGRRTFLHPTVGSAAYFDARIDPYYGAPQSVYCNEFLWPRDGRPGYKIETAPLHPVLAATVFQTFGAEHAARMAELPYAQPLIALLRDGFHEDSPGGRVRLRRDGSAVLDYEAGPWLQRGVRAAYASMAELQFAAGAHTVQPIHADAGRYTRWHDARAAIDALNLAPHRPRVFSAHVMGGCMMGAQAAHAVVDANGRHHQLENLHVMDGSVFPTSVGANPSMPIYALVARQASQLAARLRR